MLKHMIQSTVGRFIFSQGRISRVDVLTPHFRLLSLDVPGWAPADPGDKLQIMLSNGSRAYTPMNAGQGSVELLAFLHKQGPGSQWASAVRAGDTVLTFGPRRSLRFPAESTVFVGDETSVALAVNAQKQNPKHQFIFEASDASELRQVLAACGLEASLVVQKEPQGGHCALLKSALKERLNPHACVVFTGNARTIQALKKDTPKSLVKPYWAPGKRGMD
jgi:ferric-chelate reductase (NADPH)